MVAAAACRARCYSPGVVRQSRAVAALATGWLVCTVPHHGTRAQGRPLAIHEIQGSGLRSPYEGALVTTSGVVTARKSNGLFIQTPDGGDDGRAATSEGLFVFTGATPAATLAPGTLVTVSGRVIEFVPAADPASQPLTEIGGAPSIAVHGAGMTLPVAVQVRADDLSPSGGHQQLEHLEGMRVRISSLTTVGPTLGTVTESSATGASNGVFYGVVTGTGRPFREPGIDARAPLPAGAPCCVPRFDGNPERLRVDSDAQPGTRAIDVPSGALVEELVGPLDVGFGSYTILPDPSTPPRVTLPQAPERPRPPALDEVTVASFNLQRFFDATDDPGAGEVVLTAAAFQARVAKASLFVRRLLRLPPIVAVQEVEHRAALQALAAALNRDAREARELKTRYEAYVDEGNDPSGIDVGVLVDRARVEVLQVVQAGVADRFRNPTTGQLEPLNDRPPLIVRARALSLGGGVLPLTVVVNHLRSLVDIDHPTSGARVRAKRAAQAEFFAALIGRRLEDDPQEALLVVGDMNAFEFSDGYVDVVGTVRGAPAPRDQVVVAGPDVVEPDLGALTDALSPDARYSYVFDGTAQALDHVLVSPALRPLVTTFLYVRGNADAPEVWRSDPDRPERVSDHDPALVYLKVR